MRGFLMVEDCTGRRHALRATAVLAVTEVAEEGRTALAMPGGRTVVLDAALEEVVARLDAALRGGVR